MFGKNSSKPMEQKGGGGGGAPPPRSAEVPSKPAKKGLFGAGKKGAPASSGSPATMSDSPEATPGAAGAYAGQQRTAVAPKKGKGGGGLGLVFPLVIILIMAAGAYLVYTQFLGGSIPSLPTLGSGSTAQENGAAPEQGAPEQAAPAADAPTDGVLMPDELPDSGKSLRVEPPSQPRPAEECRGVPSFFGVLGFPGDAHFSTAEPGIRGVILLAPIPNSDAVSKYQHQSWSSAGFFDAHVTDRDGYTYFAPSPRTGLGVAQPTNQDHLYMLDSESGALTDYITLPSAVPPSPENPFGVMGLAYDCDSNSLYATTVTGSTAENQVGRIYRIDLNTNEVAGSLDNIDGYGAAVQTTGTGKQLVFGSARDSQIRVVDLNADGNFQGEPRTLTQLAETERARQISFPNENEMIVQAVEFNPGNAEIPQGIEVRFQYDPAADAWNQAN